jgi:integrase
MHDCTIGRVYIEPTLGKLDLAAVTPGRVRAWRSSLLSGGVGQVTVAKTYRLLRAVMNTAVDDELIRRNPCRIKGAGREATAERSVVSIEQVYRVAAAIERRWRALVLLAAFGGLRWGSWRACVEGAWTSRLGPSRSTLQWLRFAGGLRRGRRSGTAGGR